MWHIFQQNILHKNGIYSPNTCQRQPNILYRKTLITFYRLSLGKGLADPRRGNHWHLYWLCSDEIKGKSVKEIPGKKSCFFLPFCGGPPWGIEDMYKGLGGKMETSVACRAVESRRESPRPPYLSSTFTINTRVYRYIRLAVGTTNEHSDHTSLDFTICDQSPTDSQTCISWNG